MCIWIGDFALSKGILSNGEFCPGGYCLGRVVPGGLCPDYLFHTYYYLSSYAFHVNPCILSSPCHCASCQPNSLYIYVYIITYPINLIIYNLPSKSLLHHLKTVSDRSSSDQFDKSPSYVTTLAFPVVIFHVYLQ